MEGVWKFSNKTVSLRLANVDENRDLRWQTFCLNQTFVAVESATTVTMPPTTTMLPDTTTTTMMMLPAKILYDDKHVSVFLITIVKVEWLDL